MKYIGSKRRYNIPKNNKEFTENDYKLFIKGKKDLSDGLKGIVGFTYSFGSKGR